MPSETPEVPPAFQVRHVAASDVLPLRAAVLRPGLPLASAAFEGDATSTHLMILVGREVLGVATLVAGERERQLRGMAVAPSRRGRGIGTALLAEVHRIADAANADLWCNAREAAIGFYECGGWAIDSDRFVIPGVGPHARLRRRSR